MFTINTILSDTNLIIDFSQLAENSQDVARIKEEHEKDQRVDASSSGVVLFRGCCVV